MYATSYSDALVIPYNLFYNPGFHLMLPPSYFGTLFELSAHENGRVVPPELTLLMIASTLAYQPAHIANTETKSINPLNTCSAILAGVRRFFSRRSSKMNMTPSTVMASGVARAAPISEIRSPNTGIDSATRKLTLQLRNTHPLLSAPPAFGTYNHTA